MIRKARAVFISGPTTDAIIKAITGADSYRDGCIEINRCASVDERFSLRQRRQKARRRVIGVLPAQASMRSKTLKNEEKDLRNWWRSFNARMIMQ